MSNELRIKRGPDKQQTQDPNQETSVGSDRTNAWKPPDYAAFPPLRNKPGGCNHKSDAPSGIPLATCGKKRGRPENQAARSLSFS
jgi:hypothetical protein